MRNMTIFHIVISTQNPQPLCLPYMMLWILCRVTDTESGCILQMRNMTIFHIVISTQNPQPLCLPYMMLWILCRVTDTESNCILHMRNIVTFRIWAIQPYYASVSLHRIHSINIYHIWCCGFCVELPTQNPIVFFRCGILSDFASEEYNHITLQYLYTESAASMSTIYDAVDSV